MQADRDAPQTPDDLINRDRWLERDEQTFRTIADSAGLLPEGFDPGEWCRPIYREAIEWFAWGLKSSDRNYHGFLLRVLRDAATAVANDPHLQPLVGQESFAAIVRRPIDLTGESNFPDRIYDQPQLVVPFLERVRNGGGFFMTVVEACQNETLPPAKRVDWGTGDQNVLQAFRLPATHWFEILVEYLQKNPESESAVAFALHAYAPNREVLVDVLRRQLGVESVRVRGIAILELLRLGEPLQSTWLDDLWLIAAEQPPCTFMDDGFPDADADVHALALGAIPKFEEASFDSFGAARMSAWITLLCNRKIHRFTLPLDSFRRLNCVTAGLLCALEREVAGAENLVAQLQIPYQWPIEDIREMDNSRLVGLATAEIEHAELKDLYRSILVGYEAGTRPALDDDAERLLLGIWENPGDELRDLVLADWYDERDDLRGEFIRVTASLAAAPERDRGLELWTRQHELGARLRHSLGVQFSAWCRTWESLLRKSPDRKRIHLSDFYKVIPTE